jgi:membrane protein DedA with SNARE-associated domain
MTGIEALDGFLDRGLWPVYLALFVVAFLKYLAPFVPGDFVLLASVFLIGLRSGSWALAMVCITAGGAGGALAAYGVGRRYAPLVLRKSRLRRLYRRVERVLGRWGYWPLVLNRFVPYIRPALFPAAGVLRMPLRPVAAAAIGSNCLFALFLAWLGFGAGRRFSRLQSLYDLYQIWLGLLVLVLLSAAASWIFLRQRDADDEGA